VWHNAFVIFVTVELIILFNANYWYPRKYFITFHATSFNYTFCFVLVIAPGSLFHVSSAWLYELIADIYTVLCSLLMRKATFTFTGNIVDVSVVIIELQYQ